MNRGYLLLMGAVAVAMNVVSCANSGSDGGMDGIPCPYTRVSGHLLSGQITYAINNRAAGTHTLRTDQLPGECSARFFSDVTPESDAEGFAEATVFVGCEASLSEILVLQTISAPWQVAPGARTVAQRSPEIFVPGAACFGWQAGTATIDVAQGQGGAAPYPDVVTADYQRVYNVHIDVATPNLGSNACDTVTATIDAQFSETAGDAEQHPEGVCYLI